MYQPFTNRLVSNRIWEHCNVKQCIIFAPNNPYTIAHEINVSVCSDLTYQISYQTPKFKEKKSTKTHTLDSEGLEIGGAVFLPFLGFFFLQYLILRMRMLPCSTWKYFDSSSLLVGRTKSWIRFQPICHCQNHIFD